MPLSDAGIVGIFALLAAILLVGLLGLARQLGGRHPQANKDVPFESGLGQAHAARPAIPVRFYLLAVSFLVFELEGAFLYAWAVAFRQGPWSLAMAGLVFMGILGLGWVYEWRMGGLRWQ